MSDPRPTHEGGKTLRELHDEAGGTVPGTNRPERDVAVNDLRLQFQAVFGEDLDEWFRSTYLAGFNDGVAASDRRRAYIEDVMTKLKEKRVF